MRKDTGYIKKIVLFATIFLLIVLYFFFAPFHKAEAPKEEVVNNPTKNGITVTIKHTINTLRVGNKSYKLDAQKPVFSGFENKDVERHINTQIADKIDDFSFDFKKELSDWSVPDSLDDPSTLFISATTTSMEGRYESVQFSIESFMIGSAHPSSYETALNFDINTGKLISLNDVFTGDYLTVISKYCKDVLGERFADDYDNYEENFGKGSDPQTENYENFLITQNGLVVIFDQYQVAAGVAGEQTVLIPWNKLDSVIKRV
jgi:hypothetical protein